MGNTPGKPHSRPSKTKKYLQLKGADKPDAPGKPYLATDAEAAPDVLTIKWDPPFSDGGTTLTGYLVEHRRTGSPHWVKASPLKVHATELTLSGLEPGWRYQFRVFAENLIGLSEPSELSEPLTVTLQRAAITPPRFTQELKDTIALENEKVEFVAHFVGQPTAKICWFKDGFEIFSSRRTRILTESDRSVLTIHQSAICDEGEIKCTATNKAGHVSTKAKLTLEAPPSIRLPRQYEDGLLFEIGELIRLKVSVAGLPPPLIFWTHNGESLQENERYEIENDDKTSTLRIAEAVRGDRGEYQIKAVNKLGSDAASFLVTVTDKPSPPSKAKVVMTLGRSVTLSWNTPEDDGGCKIGNYIIEYYRLGWNVWLKAATSRQLTTILGDLIEGSEYKFRVKAESPFGVSEPSEESELVFIPDPKRGITEPAGGRSRSQPRDTEDPDAPIATRRRKPRSQSSTRTGYDQDEPLPSSPTRPDRFKIKSPPKTPDRLSPKPERRESNPIGINKAIFDRALTSDVQYGSPEIKIKKTDIATPKEIAEVKPQPQKPNQSLQDSIKNTIQIQEKQKAKSPSPEQFGNVLPQDKKIENTKRSEFLQPNQDHHVKTVINDDKPITRSTPDRVTMLEKKPSPPHQETKLQGLHEQVFIMDDTISNGRQKVKITELPSPRRSPSPDARLELLKSKSPSPKVLSDGEKSPLLVDRRRNPRLSSRDNSENLGGSTEFMMVLYPGVNESDMGSASEYVFELEHASVAPPLSLSAPELGTEPPVFDNLRTSASSTELLHERAMVRFYQEALAEEEALRKRRDERLSSLIPTIKINNNEDDVVGLERKHSLRRRLSAGGSVPQQVLLAQKRQSLRSSNEFSDLFDAKGAQKLSVDEKRELMRARQRSRSEEKEEEEFERVRMRMAETRPKKKISVVKEEAWEFDDEYEESLSEEEEESSEEERYRDEPRVREVVPEEEDTTYHPRTMMMSQPQQKSKFEEPFEILTKPAKLPDANFVPKPILKKKDNGDTSPQNKPEPVAFPQTAPVEEIVIPKPVAEVAQTNLEKNASVKMEGVPSFPSDDKKHDTSAIASVAGLTAAGIVLSQPILQQKEAEEAKVVIDHYGEIVKAVKQQHSVVPSSVKNLDNNPIREALKKAAALQAALHHSDEEEEEPEPVKKIGNGRASAFDERFKQIERKLETTVSQIPPRSATPIFKQAQIENKNGDLFKESGRGREANRYGVEPVASSTKPEIDKWSQGKYESKSSDKPTRKPPGDEENNRGREQSRLPDTKRAVSKSKSPHHSIEDRKARRTSPSPATSRKPSRPRKCSPSPAQSRSGSTARGKTRKNSTSSSKPPSRSSSRPPSRSSSKPRPERNTPSPDRNFLSPRRAPKMCEIMTQTSTCIDTFAVGTQSTPFEEILKENAKMKVRTTMDYTTDLAMFAVACWVFLFSNELYALPVLLVAVYRQLIGGVKSRIPNWIKKRWNREKKE